MAYNDYLYNNQYNNAYNAQQALQNSLANLQNLQAQYQAKQIYPNQNLPVMSMSNRGVFIYVADYQDVVNYPTSADGLATLFVNLDKGLLWSKKFINGQNAIQTYSITPINNLTSENQIDKESSKDEDNLTKRIDNLEGNMNKLLDLLGGKENGKL